MTPIHNFSPGPGALPESVLAQTREALDAIPGSRIPLLGLSHRTPLFAHILEEAEANFRALLTRVPDGLPTLLDYRTHVAPAPTTTPRRCSPFMWCCW